MKAVVGTKAKKRRGRKRKNEDLGEGSVNDATQYEVEIYGACNAKMKELKSKLTVNKEATMTSLPKDLQWKEAVMSFFSSPDPILQTSIALALGCDVFEGIKDLGPKTIQDKIDIFVSTKKTVVASFKTLMKN